MLVSLDGVSVALTNWKCCDDGPVGWKFSDEKIENFPRIVRIVTVSFCTTREL